MGDQREMNRIVYFAFAFYVFSLNASAKSERGTIVALRSSQNEIVVVADSRTIVGMRHFDDRCKITALGNQLIFAASNYTGSVDINSATGRASHVQWDAHAIARRDFFVLANKVTPNDLPVKLATAWGKDVKRDVEEDLARNKRSVLSVLDGDTVTQAFFAGFDNGKPIVVESAITCMGRKNPKIRFAIERIEHGRIMTFIGEDAIAHEFIKDQTPRAKQWNQEAKIRAATLGNPLWFYPDFVVYLTIHYDPGTMNDGMLIHDVGGPIDVVLLRKGKGIKWLRRKPNCPPN